MIKRNQSLQVAAQQDAFLADLQLKPIEEKRLRKLLQAGRSWREARDRWRKAWGGGAMSCPGDALAIVASVEGLR